MRTQIKYVLLLLGAIIWQITCDAQGPPWQRSEGWTIYNLRGMKFQNVPVDSLGNYPSRPLNTDSIRHFLAHSSKLSSNEAPIWMGAYVAICMVDQKKRKIDISSYGGFFLDETEGSYYEIPQDLQKEWLNYLAECAGSLRSNK